MNTMIDRAQGVLLASACGDALGVPFEGTSSVILPEWVVMSGGGYGHYEPGQWSDDTEMAICIADALARGVDPLTRDGLDAIAQNFYGWLSDNPADVGLQTRSVIGKTAVSPGEHLSDAMIAEARRHYERRPRRSAGNGGIMRCGPIALAYLDNRLACAAAARRITALTHADPLCLDNAVLMCEMIRVGVTTGRFDPYAGLDLLGSDEAVMWRGYIDIGLQRDPHMLRSPKGYTVTCFQAALSCWNDTAFAPDRTLPQLLRSAVCTRGDTDTVAAVAGAIYGSIYGASALETQWVGDIHGWPGRNATDLRLMAHAITSHKE